MQDQNKEKQHPPATPSPINLQRRIKQKVWPHAWPWFAVCKPGVEDICLSELAGLEIENLDPQPGGVGFEGGLEDAYAANMWLRTSSRVLLRVNDFRVRRWDDLVRQASRTTWEYFLQPEGAFTIQVSLTDSNLKHTGQIADVMAQGITRRFKELGLAPPLPARPDQSSSQVIMVRGVDRRCTFSLDSSGDNLHKRGYRLASGKAPLREDLAAALLWISGYSGDVPLIDPMCGSGTLAIEAALIARGLPPCLDREFAMHSWPCHREAAYGHLKKTFEANALDRAPARIMASDNQAPALKFARDNAERAGVGADIEIGQQDFFQLTPPDEPGVLVANPPYGKRIGSVRQGERFIQKMGAHLRNNFPGWRVGVVLYQTEWAKYLGLRNTVRTTVPHGGVKVTLLAGEVPA
jgi:putative N6-adenine-specific DNA methylase